MRGLPKKPPIGCTQATHQGYKRDLATFRAHTHKHHRWVDANLLTGLCNRCFSTLGFPLAVKKLRK